ncbi:hypothetical protein PAN31117_04197 [Pandoraea anapnoica]|uniref:Lipoprotein n=1 Tax=Pandoraea anapnoica TaxID=2508301 RepID=A0A5E5AIF1_9BURK|nr:hypothetical protein [Pandoraea anapnoica]VVE71870.1 hypothetical protein PAN31117_04197 [Pandoraea anapnoica]
MYKNTILALGVAAAMLSCATAFAATSPEPATAAAAQIPAGFGEKVDMKYDALASENPIGLVQTGTCKVHIAPAVDARQNKETIGASGSGALLADNVSPWMSEGLGHLKDYGYDVADIADGAPAPAQGVTIRTSVTRAYTWQIGLKLFSMVAVKAEFIDRNGVLETKYYRAHGDKTNMWGANAEYVTTLNYGLNNMLPFIARDLQSLCRGEKVEEYTYAGPDGVPKK